MRHLPFKNKIHRKECSVTDLGNTTAERHLVLSASMPDRRLKFGLMLSTRVITFFKLILKWSGFKARRHWLI